MLLILCWMLLLASGGCHPQRRAQQVQRRAEHEPRPSSYSRFHETISIRTSTTVSTNRTEASTRYTHVPTLAPAKEQNSPPSAGDLPGSGPPQLPDSSQMFSPWSEQGASSWEQGAPSGGNQGTQSWIEQEHESAHPPKPSKLGPQLQPPPGLPISQPPYPPWPSPGPTAHWPSTAASSHPSSSVSTASQTSSTAQPTTSPDDWPGHTVTGYFGSGNDHTKIFPAEKIPWQFLTHLCYAFAKTNGAESNYSLSFNATLLRYLSDQAKAHGVKLILSIGGYGEGGQYFSDIVQTNSTINAFVTSVKTVVSTYELAGVDIDWEFVGYLSTGANRPFTDAHGYLDMLKALRAAMPSAELSAAVPMWVFLETESADSEELVYTNMLPYVDYFDRIYLMSYDLWNGNDMAGSNGALGPASNSTTPVNPNQNTGFDGVEAWSTAGFPMDKLVYGVPFYGKGYKLQDDADPAKTGLYTPADGKSSGDSNENPQGDSGFWKWRNLVSQNIVQQQADGDYTAGPGWTYGFDLSTQTPYVYEHPNATDPQIISYDDPHSLRIKRDYAKNKGMNGMMFWAMYGDTDDGELTHVLA